MITRYELPPIDVLSVIKVAPNVYYPRQQSAETIQKKEKADEKN